EHLAAREELHPPEVHLPHHRLVRPEEELLARLPSSVERARHERAAEAPVVELTTVLARERHALRDRLVDDVRRKLREPVDDHLELPLVRGVDELDLELVLVPLLGERTARDLRIELDGHG